MFKFSGKKKTSSGKSEGNESQTSLPSNLSLNQTSGAEIPTRKESADIQNNGVPSSAGAASGTLLVRVAEIMGLAPQANALPYVLAEVDKDEVVIKASSADSRSIHFQQKANFDISRKAPVEISLYAPGEKEDTLVGTLNFNPTYLDQKLTDEWLEIQPSIPTQNPIVARVLVLFKTNQKNKSLTIDDFELLKVIGKGSFGKVMQVRKRDSNRIYAMKILKKAHIVERDEVSHTIAERLVLAKLNHPFIVNLKYSFQSPEKLYLALAFVNGGELFHHLQVEGKFSEPRAKFYTAELLTALDCLHSYNVIYRDLKPENILLDYAGHIALCDFGLCKLNMNDGKKTNTFCGTPEYLAPEVLEGKGYTKAVDWWTLGILLYEMITGLPPFYDENVNNMYKKILSEPLTFPAGVSVVAEDLLRKLLDRNPSTRLGVQGAQPIKDHPFFTDVDWRRLLAKKYTPPFRPNVKSALDTSNFDDEFTNELPVDSVADTSHLSDAVQQQFQGFTYQATEAIAGSLGVSLVNNKMGSLALSHMPAHGGLSSVDELSHEKTIAE